MNVALAKVFKFVTFVLFTFMTLVYFGVLLLLPLDILFQVIRVFHAIGLPTVIAVAIGLGALFYVGKAFLAMPALYELLLDIGKEIINFGHAQIRRFDAIINAAGASEA
jgi:hypothetical protein